MPWGQVVNLRGPQGIPGPAGSEGPQGIQGPPGPAGEGIAIAGSVPTYDALPTGLTEADAGDGYLVEADGLLYIWSGTAFPANGAGAQFRGPEGPAGPQGEIGPAGPTGQTGLTGQTGPTGATGPRGSKWFTGVGAPTTVTGSQVGDFYLDTSDGAVYELT